MLPHICQHSYSIDNGRAARRYSGAASPYFNWKML